MPIVVIVSLASTLMQPCHFIITDVIITLCDNTMGKSSNTHLSQEFIGRMFNTVSSSVNCTSDLDKDDSYSCF